MMVYRKMMMTGFAFVLCACLCAPCFAGGQGGRSASGTAAVSANLNPTGLPILKEQETYTIAYQRNAISQNNMVDKEAVKRSVRDTNILINWTEIPATSWTERLNIMFASGDLPDAVAGIPQNIMMQNLSQLVPLTDFVPAYSPIVTKFFEDRPDIKALETAPDGQIYSFPSAVEAPWNITDDCLFMNRVFLEKLNLQAPTTTEEFYSVLKAFKENDVNGNGNRNDEIPFSFCQGIVSLSLKSMFGSFGVLDNAEHLQVIDDVVTFGPALPGFLEALRYFNRLYSEGLIDEEAFSHSQQQYIAKGRETPGVYGSLIANLVGNIVGIDKIADYVPVAPLKGPSGKQLWNRGRGNGLNATGFVITKKCKDPAVLVRWYDYIHSSFELMMLWRLGPENQAWGYNEEGLWNNIMDNVPSGSSFDEYWFTVAVGGAPVCPQIYDFNRPDIRNIADENTLNKIASQSLVEPFFPAAVIPQGLEEQNVIQERAILFADIDTYLKNFISTSIMQGITDAQWNEHLRNTERMNVSAYVKPYQDLYDRSRR